MTTNPLPIADVLGNLEMEPLPEGGRAESLVAFIKLQGGEGWSVRVTPDLCEEEILGVLVGYTAHLRDRAAAAWED